jgi:hypothetical protein
LIETIFQVLAGFFRAGRVGGAALGEKVFSCVALLQVMVVLVHGVQHDEHWNCMGLDVGHIQVWNIICVYSLPRLIADLDIEAFWIVIEGGGVFIPVLRDGTFVPICPLRNQLDLENKNLVRTSLRT